MDDAQLLTPRILIARLAPLLRDLSEIQALYDQILHLPAHEIEVLSIDARSRPHVTVTTNIKLTVLPVLGRVMSDWYERPVEERKKATGELQSDILMLADKLVNAFGIQLTEEAKERYKMQLMPMMKSLMFNDFRVSSWIKVR
jgi:hypothetical protein